MEAQGVRSESSASMSFDGALKHLFGLEKKLRVEMLENIRDLKLQMTSNRIDLVAKKATKLFEIRHQLFSSKVLYRQEKDIMDEFEKLKVILESVPNAEDNGWNRAKSDCFVLGAQLNEVRKRQSTLSTKVQELETNVEELLSVPLDDLDSYDIESLKREEIQYEKMVPTLSSYSMGNTAASNGSNFPQKTPDLETFQPISAEKVELDTMAQPSVEAPKSAGLEPQKSVEINDNQIHLDHTEEPLSQIIEPLEAYAAKENTRTEIDQMLKDFEEQGDLKQEIFGSWLAAKESDLKKETGTRGDDPVVLDATPPAKPAKKKKKKTPKASTEQQNAESEDTKDKELPSFYSEQDNECWSEASKQITERVEEEKIKEQTKKSEEELLAAEAQAQDTLRLEEEQRLEEERRLQNETQLTQEKTLHQEAKILEDAKAADEMRVTDGEKLAQEAKILEGHQLLEEQRLKEEAELFEALKAAEDLRIKEQELLVQEAKAQEDFRIAEKQKMEEEAQLLVEQRVIEEARIQQEQKLAEEVKLQEDQRLAEESRLKEEQRLAEESRLKEEQRLAEEARSLEEQRLAEEARSLEKQRLAEESRLKEEERLAEEAKLREEQLLAEEIRLKEVQKLAEAERILEEQRLAEEARILEEQRLAEEARSLEEQRLAEEARSLEKQRLAEESRLKEEERLAEEAKLHEEQLLAEEIRLKEVQRLAEAERILEEQRLAEEARILEERSLAEEAKFQEEQRFAEEAKLKEEQRLAEKNRLQEEQRLAEEARLKEEQRLVEEARSLEEQRLAEETRSLEEQRLAEETRILEEQRLADEARIAEEQKVAEEASLQEKQRLAEESKFKEELKLAEETRLKEEQSLAEEARILEEQRLAEEMRLRTEQILTEEAKLKEEQILVEEMKFQEEQRLAEKVKIEDELQFAEVPTTKPEQILSEDSKAQEPDILEDEPRLFMDVPPKKTEALAEETRKEPYKSRNHEEDDLNVLKGKALDGGQTAEEQECEELVKSDNESQHDMQKLLRESKHPDSPQNKEDPMTKEQIIAEEAALESNDQIAQQNSLAGEAPANDKTKSQKNAKLSNKNNANGQQSVQEESISNHDTSNLSVQESQSSVTNSQMKAQNRASSGNQLQSLPEDQLSDINPQDTQKPDQNPPKRKKKVVKPPEQDQSSSVNVQSINSTFEVEESRDGVDGVGAEPPFRPEKKTKGPKGSDDPSKNITNHSQSVEEPPSEISKQESHFEGKNGNSIMSKPLSEQFSSDKATLQTQNQDTSKGFDDDQDPHSSAKYPSKENIFAVIGEAEPQGTQSPSVPKKMKKKKKAPTPEFAHDPNEVQQSDQAQTAQSNTGEDSHLPLKPEKKKRGNKEIVQHDSVPNKDQLLEQPDEPKRSRSELRELSAINEDEARLLQDLEEQNLERIEAEFVAHKMVMEQEAQMEQDALNQGETKCSGATNAPSKQNAVSTGKDGPEGPKTGMAKDVVMDVNEKLPMFHTTDDSQSSQNPLSKPEVDTRSTYLEGVHEEDSNNKNVSGTKRNKTGKKLQDKNKANDDVNKTKTELDLEPMMLPTNQMSPEISESVSTADGDKGSKQPLDPSSSSNPSHSKQRSSGTVTWKVDEKEESQVEEHHYSKIKKNKGKKSPSDKADKADTADESRTFLNQGLLETEFPVLSQPGQEVEEEDIYSKPIKPKKKPPTVDVPYDVPKSARSIESSPEPHYIVPTKGSKSKVTIQEIQRAKARVAESQTSLDKAVTATKIDGKKAKPGLKSIIDLEIPEAESDPVRTDQANGAKHVRDKNKTDKVSSDDEEAHHDDDNDMSKDTFNTITQAQKPDNLGSNLVVAKDTDKLYSSDFDYTDLDTVEQPQPLSGASPLQANHLEEEEDEDPITRKTSKAKKLSNTFKSLIKRDKPEENVLAGPKSDQENSKAKRSLLNFMKREKDTAVEHNDNVDRERIDEENLSIGLEEKEEAAFNKEDRANEDKIEDKIKSKEKKSFKALFQRDKSSIRENEGKSGNGPDRESAQPKPKRSLKNLISRDSSLSKEQNNPEQALQSTTHEPKAKRTFKNFIKRDSSTRRGEENLKEEPRELKGLNSLATRFSRPANGEQDFDPLEEKNKIKDRTISSETNVNRDPDISLTQLRNEEENEQVQTIEELHEESNRIEQTRDHDVDLSEIPFAQENLEHVSEDIEEDANTRLTMQQESLPLAPKPMSRKNKPSEVKFSNDIAIVVENVDKLDKQPHKPTKEKSLFQAFMKPKEMKTNDESPLPPGLGKLMTGKQALLKHPSPKQRVMSLDRKGRSGKTSGSKVIPPTPDEETPHSIENIPVPPQKRARSLDRRALKQQNNQGGTLVANPVGDIPHIAQITPGSGTLNNATHHSFKNPGQTEDSATNTLGKEKKQKKKKKDKVPEELRKMNFKTVDELKLPKPPVPKRGNKLKRSSSLDNVRRTSLLLQVPGFNTLPKQRSRSADTRMLEREINAGVSFQAIAPLVQEIAEERNLRLKEVTLERFDTTLPIFSVDMPDMNSKARERNERLKVVQQPYTATLQPPKPERRRSKSTEIATLPREGIVEVPVKPKRSRSKDASLQRLKQKTPYSVTELQKLQERKKQLTLDFVDLQVKTGEVREKLKTPFEKDVVLAAIADTSLLAGRRGRGLTRKDDEVRRQEAIEQDRPVVPKVTAGARQEQTWDQLDFYGTARGKQFDTMDSGISEYKNKYYFSSDDEDESFEDPIDSSLDQDVTLDSMGRPKKVSFASLERQWKLKLPHKIPNEDKSWPALPQGFPERPYHEVPRASPGLLHARMEENEPLRNKASPNLNFIMQQQVSREPMSNENGNQDTSPRAFLDAMTGGRISGPTGTSLSREPSVPKDDGGGLFGSLMKKGKGLSSKKTSRASSRTNSTERGSVLKRVFHKASSAEPISKKSEALGNKATRKITLPLPNKMTEAASVGNFATLPSPDPEVPNLSDTPMSKKNKKSSTSKIEAVDFDKLFERGHAQSSLGGLNLVDSRLLGPDGAPKHNQPNSSLSYEEKVQSFLDEQTIGGSSQTPAVDKNELRSHYSTRIDPSPNRSRNTSKADIKSKPKFKIRSRDSSLSSRPGHSRPVSPLDFLKKLEGLAKDVEVEREYEENVWPAVNPNLPGVFDTRPPSQRDNRKDGTYTEPTQAHLDALNSMNLSPRGQVPNQTERKLSNVTSYPEQVLSSLIIQPPLAQTNLPPPLSPSLRNNPNQPSNNLYSNPNQFAFDVSAPSNSNQDSLDPNSSWAWAGNDQGPPVPPNRRPSSPWALNASNQQQPMAQPRRKSIGAQLAAQDPSGMGQFLSAQDASHGQSRSASHSPNRFGSDNAGSHIPLNVPADRHLPARLLPDPLSKDMSNHPGMNPHDPSKSVENTELYKRLHDGLQTVENLILSSPFHQEQQITQRTKEQLQGADLSGQRGPQPMSSQVYSQNLGRAEFGTLRKRDQTQRAPGGASAVPSRDPSGERPRSRATSGTFAQSRPSALISRQNSQDSNLSHLSDSHYPDLEFNTNSRPGSSMGTKPTYGVLHNTVPSSGESSRSNWATQRSGSSLNPTPMVLEKKKAVLERIEKEKQLVKEAKSQMLILLLLGLCICILIYLQSEET